MRPDLKRLYKLTIPRLPGYHRVCLALRAIRPEAGWGWVDRVPVKPGLLVPVSASTGNLVMTHPERCSIAKKYFWTRGVRRPEADRVALDLFGALAATSDVVLDIGANSGLFSLVAAQASPAAEVVAFDILPEALQILRDNLQANGMLERVELRLAGVGRSGTWFDAPVGSITSELPTSISLEWAPSGGPRTRVRVVSLDEICLPRFAGKRVTAKIDVEATESQIFADGERTLAEVRPRFVCEVLPYASDVALYDGLLGKHGYEKFIITDTGLRIRPTVEPHERFRDWLFVPRGDAGEVIRRFTS